MRGCKVTGSTLGLGEAEFTNPILDSVRTWSSHNVPAVADFGMQFEI